MGSYEEPTTQIPEIGLAETFTEASLHEPLAAGLTARERILGSRIGVAFAAFATSLGIAGAGELASARTAMASQHMMTPDYMIKSTSEFMATTLFNGSDDQFRLNTENLYRHTLRRSGWCPANPNDSPFSYLTSADSFGPKRYDIVDCLEGPSGRQQTIKGPSKQLLAPVNFTTLINRLGNGAAESVGLSYSRHGEPSHISIKINRNKDATTKEADVYYNRSAGGAGHGRSIHILKLLVKTSHGHRTETDRKIPYPIASN